MPHGPCCKPWPPLPVTEQAITSAQAVTFLVGQEGRLIQTNHNALYFLLKVSPWIR